MRYGKLIICATFISGLAGCSLIPPTDEQPPTMPPPNIEPLKGDGQNTLYPVSQDDSYSSPDDSAPVVVPPALSKNGSGS